jgi:uncharacterized Rmd1/YagE family protein
MDGNLCCSIVNDAITLSSNLASEKLAISFAMAQSAKLDVFEERVEETIQQTKHIPQNLATTGSIQYSQGDISKLIGRLFIEVPRTSVLVLHFCFSCGELNIRHYLFA